MPFESASGVDEYSKANRANWNERVNYHFSSRFYDVAGFLSGCSTLRPIELQALGDISGKRILHLQCHFGLDTLSLNRMGALVTGVDFSENAIEKARALAAKTQQNVKFVCCDVLELDKVSSDRDFDLVFASYGIFCWISDLNRWFQVAHQMLRSNGRVYLVDGHPILDSLDIVDGSAVVVQRQANPVKCEVRTSYTEGSESLKNSVTYQWTHRLEDFREAASSAGFKTIQIDEYPYCHYQRFPQLVQRFDGYWELPGNELPMLFSMNCARESPVV